MLSELVNYLIESTSFDRRRRYRWNRFKLSLVSLKFEARSLTLLKNCIGLRRLLATAFVVLVSELTLLKMNFASVLFLHYNL